MTLYIKINLTKLQLNTNDEILSSDIIKLFNDKDNEICEIIDTSNKETITSKTNNSKIIKLKKEKQNLKYKLELKNKVIHELELKNKILKQENDQMKKYLY